MSELGRLAALGFPTDDEEWEFEDDHIDPKPEAAKAAEPAGLWQSSSSGPALGRAASYTIAGEDESTDELQQRAANVAELTLLPAEECAVMLPTFAYDDEALVQAFFDDEARCRAKCHCTAEAELRGPPLPDGETLDSDFTCEMCWGDFRYRDADALACGHWACSDCWAGHLRELLEAGPRAVAQAHCFTCEERVRPRLWQLHLPEEAGRASEWRLKDFLDTNMATKYCPARGCGLAVTYPKQTKREIACPCGHRWCFACSREWHGSGLSCTAAKAWEEKTSPDAANYKWLKAFSRPCPKCKKPIQKNGGCLHMTCGKGSSAGCGHEFCWFCMKPWGPHGSNWFSCSAPKSEDVKAAEAKAKAEKASLGQLQTYADLHRERQVRQDDLLSRQRPKAVADVAAMLAAGVATERDAFLVSAFLPELSAGHLAVKTSQAWAFLHSKAASVASLLTEVRFRQAELVRTVDEAQKDLDEDVLGMAAAAAAAGNKGEASLRLAEALGAMERRTGAVRRLVRNLDDVLGEAARLQRDAADAGVTPEEELAGAAEEGGAAALRTSDLP